MTKSQEIATDVQALLRARTGVLWVKTREEARVELHLFEAAAAAGYTAMTWDVAQGIADVPGDLMAFTLDDRTGSNTGRFSARRASANDQDPALDPGACMTGIAAAARRGDALTAMTEEQRANAVKTMQRTVWIMRDLPAWLPAGPQGAPTIRQLRNLARMLPSRARESAQAIIVLTPAAAVPEELAGHVTVIEWPLPDREEIADALDSAIESLPDELKASAAPNGQREKAIDAAVGLAGAEASACYARSLVQLRRIDPVLIAKEKKRVVAREGVLQWYDPMPFGLEGVGGLEALKPWLVDLQSSFTPEARDYGLPLPKGAMLVGLPGGGKSFIIKCLGTTWMCPVLRADLGALKSKFVGESEAMFRRALNVVDTVGRCILWIDEIEKGMQGATSGSADGGVSTDQLGTLLTWMQERTSAAFVMATANDIEGLPPELLRKGRFDEIWFIDAPNRAERRQVVRAALMANSRKEEIDEAAVAAATDGFTAAEIAALVPAALRRSFNDGRRPLATDDLLVCAKGTIPMTKTSAEKVAKLRDWAKGRAVLASLPDEDVIPVVRSARAKVALDI